MVSSRYLLRQPAVPPSELKRFFGQRVMPAAIDGAACLDVGILKTAKALRQHPAIALALAAAAGILLEAALRSRRRF